MKKVFEARGLWSKGDVPAVHDALPPGGYEILITDKGPVVKGTNLKHIDESGITPHLIARADRAAKSYRALGGSMACLLTGKPGTGKSLFQKLIINRFPDMPVFFINQELGGELLASVINPLTNQAIIIFDEFEKVYKDENDEIVSMLSFLDGGIPHNHFCILTANRKPALEQLYGRPTRIRYHWDSGKVTPEEIRYLVNLHLPEMEEERREEYIRTMIGTGVSNYDEIFAWIQEIIIHQLPPTEISDGLNSGGDGNIPECYVAHAKGRVVRNTVDWSKLPEDHEVDTVWLEECLNHHNKRHLADHIKQVQDAGGIVKEVSVDIDARIDIRFGNMGHPNNMYITMNGHPNLRVVHTNDIKEIKRDETGMPSMVRTTDLVLTILSPDEA